MKEKKQLAWLVGLVLVAILVWYFQSRPETVRAGIPLDAANYKPFAVENPALHWWKLDASRKTEYRSSGRNPFSAVVEPPPVNPVVKAAAHPVGPVPPPPPALPQLPGNVKFFGYGTVPNGTARRAFLTDGDDVFIVGEGDTLLGRFRVTHIGNTSMEFEDTSTHMRNSVPLDESQVAPA
jgi:hypothetical protein